MSYSRWFCLFIHQRGCAADDESSSRLVMLLAWKEDKGPGGKLYTLPIQETVYNILKLIIYTKFNKNELQNGGFNSQ